MTTQRKTTGASALVDIMKEVYDTKLRMKATINKVIETNSDDFEEYATLTHNAIVKEYNRGIAKGYADGWHVVFPSAQITPDMYEEYYHSYNTYTPSIPTYTTDTDVDNLVIMMRDNLRCRLLLKNELSTNSDEFVTYPDLLEELYVFSYQDGYDTAYEIAIQKATDSSYGTPTIIHLSGSDTVAIVSNAQISGLTLYYWIDSSAERQEYTGPITIVSSCTVYAANMSGSMSGPVAERYCDLNSYGNGVIKVSLPKGVTSTYVTARAITINMTRDYGEAYYSYDGTTWNRMTSIAADGSTQVYFDMQTFELNYEHTDIYFKTGWYSSYEYSQIELFSNKVVNNTGVIAEAATEWSEHNVYIGSLVDYTSEEAVDIAGNADYINYSNRYRIYYLSNLKVNNAKYYDYGGDSGSVGNPSLGFGCVIAPDLNILCNSTSFQNNSRLTELTCTSISNSNSNWLYGVADKGSLIKPFYATELTGIPANWGVYDIPAECYIYDSNLYDVSIANYTEDNRLNLIEISVPNAPRQMTWVHEPEENPLINYCIVYWINNYQNVGVSSLYFKNMYGQYLKRPVYIEETQLNHGQTLYAMLVNICNRSTIANKTLSYEDE